MTVLSGSAKDKTTELQPGYSFTSITLYANNKYWYKGLCMASMSSSWNQVY